MAFKIVFKGKHRAFNILNILIFQRTSSEFIKTSFKEYFFKEQLCVFLIFYRTKLSISSKDYQVDFLKKKHSDSFWEYQFFRKDIFLAFEIVFKGQHPQFIFKIILFFQKIFLNERQYLGFPRVVFKGQHPGFFSIFLKRTP